jgi:hypothetical protein
MSVYGLGPGSPLMFTPRRFPVRAIHLVATSAGLKQKPSAPFGFVDPVLD